MKGWRRLGIVLSVLWFVGFGGWLWFSEVDRHSKSHMDQLTNCFQIESLKRGAIRWDDPQRDEKIAEIATEHRACMDEAGEFFMRPRPYAWVLILIDAGVLAVFWLVAWLTVVVGRWVAAGFRKPA
jgi:hypothetical protein